MDDEIAKKLTYCIEDLTEAIKELTEMIYEANKNKLP